MLEKEIQYLKGVGPSRAEKFRKLGINNLKDLIEYYPRDYEDRTNLKNIIELSNGSFSLIKAKLKTNVTSINRFNGRTRKQFSIQKAIIEDKTGTSNVMWYNRPYLSGQLKVGEEYYFYGETKVSSANFEILNSEVEEIEKDGVKAGNIVSIYGLTAGLTQNIFRTTIRTALIEAEHANIFSDFYSDEFLKKYNLIDLKTVMKNIHFPESNEMIEKARRRLIFDELFIISLMLFHLKQQNKKGNGPIFDKNVSLNAAVNDLPFRLTSAQLRVLDEVENDLEGPLSMDRLLQGDVGSGKTIISILAAYKAVKSGFQTAILAPTVILAIQHYTNFKNFLEKYDIKMVVLTSSLKKKEKEDALKKIKSGEVDVIIGTHALLEEAVEFKNLGLVVTDEQHRFGVKQRETILSKGMNPNTLVMSATPIPRTLALILYGDLDISIIDELPPNRKDIKTIALNYRATEKIYSFISAEIEKGRQTYVVCPLIEENEELDLNSVQEIYEKYKKKFDKYNVSFMHGRMKDKEKEDIMKDFKSGNIDILVSTTVIEVGVDVPNANIMIIENAERFGLAQLHQLRGRVGRGEYQSYCILKARKSSAKSKERIHIMEKTTDGFIIAEKDLEMRGSGDFFGTKQHGLPDFKIANLFTDIEILKETQKIAIEIIESDKDFQIEENNKIGIKVKNMIQNIVL